MRRKGRIDANQPEVVEHLRAHGMSVCILSPMGKGIPDLLVGCRGVNVLIELKDGSKRPSEQKLTTDEADWHRDWRGQICVANSREAALREVEKVLKARAA